MVNYTVTLTKRSQKQLDKLTDQAAEPIGQLAGNPRPPGHKKLKGRDGYRIRVGDYRVIYEIFDDVMLVDVINLGHRKDIYD